MIPNLKAFAAQAKQKFGGGAPKMPFGGKPGGGKPGMGGKGQDAIAIAAQVAKDMAAGKIDGQIAKLMKGYDADDEVPAWALDEHLWQQAESAVQPEGKGKSLDEPWMHVALVYKGLGGRIQPGAHAEPDGDEGDGGEGPEHPDMPEMPEDDEG